MSVTHITPTQTAPHPFTATERARLRQAMLVAEQTTGLQAARKAQQKALTAYEAALDGKREAEVIVREAQADHDDHIAVLAYQLAGRFGVRANKQVLDTEPDRTFTADEKKAWIANQIGQDDEARSLASNLRAAQTRLDEARDRIAVQERSISACKAEIAAAIALTELLTASAFTSSTNTNNEERQPQ